MFYCIILENRSYTREDTRLHTLISYVLLLLPICLHSPKVVPFRKFCHMLLFITITDHFIPPPYPPPPPYLPPPRFQLQHPSWDLPAQGLPLPVSLLPGPAHSRYDDFSLKVRQPTGRHLPALPPRLEPREQRGRSYCISSVVVW